MVNTSFEMGLSHRIIRLEKTFVLNHTVYLQSSLLDLECGGEGEFL